MEFITLSKERSGSHLLGGLLSSHPKIQHVVDVLHPEHKHLGYFGYLKEKLKENVDLCVPSDENRTYLLDHYFEFLRKSKNGSEIAGFDVKYAASHNFAPVWSRYTDIPFLLKFMMDRGTPIIHLVRRNVLRTHVSHVLAKSRGVYVATDSTEYSINSVSIETTPLLRQLDNRSKEIEYFRSILRSYHASIELKYEELLVDGIFDSLIVEQISRILQLSADFNAVPKYKKLAHGDMSDLIDNYDDVVGRLKESEFEWMLYD